MSGVSAEYLSKAWRAQYRFFATKKHKRHQNEWKSFCAFLWLKEFEQSQFKRLAQKVGPERQRREI
jgi:hypothetical protein